MYSRETLYTRDAESEVWKSDRERGQSRYSIIWNILRIKLIKLDDKNIRDNLNLIKYYIIPDNNTENKTVEYYITEGNSQYSGLP